MTELIFEVVEDPECGYRADALGVEIYTYGKDLDELREKVREAVDCYYEGEDTARPAVVRLHFVRDEVLSW